MLSRVVEISEWKGVVSRRRLRGLLYGFVGLGAVLRLSRFLLEFPLSIDEAKLASSWLDRDYAQLLDPLDYWQVAPTLFLWANLAVTRLLGLSELSLRLLPLVLGLAGLFLVQRLSSRLLPELPALLAVAVFSVSYYPIRLASEAKPYSTDLFFGVAITILAVSVLSRPERRRWIAVLAVAAPVAIVSSYPSIFIIAGVAAAMTPMVWRADWRVRVIWGAFVVAALTTFLVTFWILRAQYQDVVEVGTNLDFWSHGFPSLADPLGMIRWLVSAHTSRTFAYPVGGDQGGSTLTFLCFAGGAVFLYRAGKWLLLAVLVLPFVLMMGAAVLQYYPYGGSGRISQHLAPAICILVGLGSASFLARFQSVESRRRALFWALGVLAFFGVGSGVRDVIRPFLESSSIGSRDFARWFWTEKARDAELVCALVDAPGGSEYRGQLPFLPRYWSNQRIYSERHRLKEAPRWDRISEQHPLRVAVPRVDLDEKTASSITDSVAQSIAASDAEVSAWLETLRSEYRQVGVETLAVERYRNGRVWVDLYELVPRDEE